MKKVTLKNRFNFEPAFTLAEVLITLAIIGIVASLTIPNVIKNYQERQYNAARLKALASIGGAIRMLSITGEAQSGTSAKNFVENVLSKKLKITKSCTNPSDCNFPSKIKNMAGGTLNTPTQWKNLDPQTTTFDRRASSHFFQTADGFSVDLFYNSKCKAFNQYDSSTFNSGDLICVNAIYDMNGKKAPNEAGKDIGFVSVFFPGLSSVAVAPLPAPISINPPKEARTGYMIASFCNSLGDYRVPTLDELSAISINNPLTQRTYGSFISLEPYQGSSKYIWTVAILKGARSSGNKGSFLYTVCVKK